MSESPDWVGELETAGALRRAVATLIDIVIFLLLSAALVWPVFRAIDWRAAGSDLDQLLSAITAPAWESHAAGIVGLWLGLWWAYFVIGWGLCGATPGKWCLGLRVVDHHQRLPIGPTRAVLRLLAYSVASLSLGWGHLLIAFRSDRRALHDILAGTRVVRWRQPPQPEAPECEPAPEPQPERRAASEESAS